MRRVSIGMIEAVLLIKYRNTQPDSTAVLRKEYRSTLRTVLQYFYGVLADASAIYPSRYYRGRTSAMAPPRIPLGIGVAAWCVMYGIVPRQLFPALLYLIIFGRGRAFRRTYRTGRAMAFPGGG